MESETSNGVVIENGEDAYSYKTRQNYMEEQVVTLYSVFNGFISSVFFPNPDSSYASMSFVQRIKAALSVNVPLLCEASRNTGHNVLLWTRRGSPLRALLVVSIGTVTLLSLTGLLVFMLFFLAATVNAVIISLFMSLAAAGGFLAFFFACVTAIYIGALCVAAFVISTATISAVIAALIAAGWMGFFFTVWLVATKSLHLAKQSLSMTGSAVSAYSSAWQTHRRPAQTKVSD